MKSFNFFSNHVKNLPILLAFLTISIGTVWGASETVSIADIASANSWSNGTHYSGWTSTSGNFTFTAANTGQGLYYSSDDSWRGYNSKGAITITAAAGITITSVTSTPSKTWSLSGNTAGNTASFTPTATTKFTQFVITYSGGTSYTITAISNNNTWGTVSGTTTITATPAVGYRVVAGDGGYTVTSGTATVTNNGDNTFSVSASSDCTVRINFEAIPTHKVIWSSNGDNSNQVSYAEGANIVFPASAEGCDGKTFMGWSAVPVAEQDDAPAYTTAATMGTSDVTYYAVFATSSGGGGTSAFDNSTAGTYKIYADVGGTKYYAVGTGSKIASTTNSAEATEYTFEKVTGGWAIKTGSTYITYSSSTNLGTSTSAYTWTISSGTHGTSRVAASTSGRAWIFRAGSTNQFGGYATTNVTLSSEYYDLEIVGGSSYTGYTTSCVACEKKVTLTKGEEVNGTFTLNKTNGSYNNCATNFVVTVSGITPASGYYCTGVTATGGANVAVSGPDGSGNYTVTYTKDNNITSTITANFAPNPTYTVTWSKNGDVSDTEEYEEGEAIVFPVSADGCDGKVFRGWSAAPVAETDIEPSYVTSATMPAHDVTYYAVFAEASGSGEDAAWTETAITDLTGTDIFVIVGNTGSANYALPNNASGTPDVISVTISDGKITSTVANNLKWNISGNSTSGYTFYPNGSTTTWLYSNTTASSSSNTNIRIGSGARKVWSYTSGNQLVTDDEYTDRYLAVQGGSDFRGYTSSTTSATTFKFYAYSAGTTYSGYTTTCGAGISAQNVGWITSSVGQKVKRVINVSAKNFDEATTLAATCANSNFDVTLGETAVPAGAAGLTTTLTVEYMPTAQGREENVEIELTAGDKSRTITVNGRCVPDEFLLITKKSSTWYALPANMTGGPGEYAGIEVAPNDNTTPTVVPVSPSTAIYHLASNAADRYETAGQCVRLVGMGELCLWSNMAESTTKVNIQNKVSVSSASGVNYDWLLTTTDGIRYSIANPNHPHYSTGRRLAYGEKFGMYTEETEFFIVSAGCTSMPDNVLVSPHRVDATFSWMCTAPSVTIDIYTNEAMTEGHLSATVSSAPYIFTGLAETTDYWFKLTPGTDTDCAVTGSFKTTGPSIDIVEWQQEAVILHIDEDETNPVIVIDGQEEHGSITGGGGTATELFFAKYFEGAGSMKLVSIFNGTTDDINLSPYSIYVKMRGGSGSWSPGNDVDLDLGTLGSIKAGQEIIFFSRPLGTETALDGCSSSFLDDKVTNHSSAESNPRWVECDGGTYSRINFNGNDPILFKKSGTLIDVIGSESGSAPTATNCLSGDGEKGWGGTVRNMDKGKSPSDPSFDAFYDASSKSPVTSQDSIDLLTAFGINLDDAEIPLTTARCIFFRDKRVTNGDSAVLMNGSTFVTFTNHDAFKSEWYGRSVCMNDAAKTAAGVTNDAQATCNSYQDIANMDYNEYYIDYTSHIEEGKTLDQFTSDPETKEYTIPIPDLVNYTCLNIRFQLKQGGNVVTEVAQQVPIMVDGSKTTSDALFSELVVDKGTGDPSYSHSVERCRTCDVVILGTGTLTKAADSDVKDVPEVGNVKVYPGGKLVVPSTTTNYTVKSLAFRRQEDAVSTANIEGNLNIGTDDAVYLDMRVDPTNWHYFTLPYDCNVADIRFANPNETTVPTLGTDYMIKWYNGEKRAATQAGGCWEMVAPDATLKKGIGYIFALPGEGKERQEFRFPMSNAVVTEEKATYKQANGIYAYGGDKSMTEVRANHRGWNLIGDPYLLPYSSDIADPVITGYIVPDYPEDPEAQWDGHYKFADDARSDLRYIVEPVDNGRSEYIQVPITAYEMKPFTSYFVQIGGGDPEAIQGVQFNLSRVNRSASPIRRAPAEYEEVEDTHPVWCAVTLTNPNGEKDETTMLISNDFTDEYDMMNDLVKMRGTYYQYAQITTKPVLASRNNEGEMAFNALPDSSALAGIPLNYFAASQGSYTIAYNDKYDKDREVKEVKLWDKTTNQWYNLMDEPYTFNTARTDNKDRFVLSVRVERKQNQVTTSIEDLNSYSGDKPRKLLINGHVYIQRGKDIYDVTGKQVENF